MRLHLPRVHAHLAAVPCAPNARMTDTLTVDSGGSSRSASRHLRRSRSLHLFRRTWWARPDLAYLVEMRAGRADHVGRGKRSVRLPAGYVNIGDVDAGLRLIKNRLAIAPLRLPRRLRVSPARTGLHRRRQGERQHKCATPAPAPHKGAACAPGYSPCVPPYPPDVDCADTTDPLRQRD